MILLRSLCSPAKNRRAVFLNNLKYVNNLNEKKMKIDVDILRLLHRQKPLLY